jgi:hypothetical protein
MFLDLTAESSTHQKLDHKIRGGHDVYPTAHPDPPSLYVPSVFLFFYDFLNVWAHYDNYSSCHMDISALVCVLYSQQYINVRRSVLLYYSFVLCAV